MTSELKLPVKTGEMRMHRYRDPVDAGDSVDNACELEI